MTDSTLGITVKQSGIDKASADLAELANRADRAEAAVAALAAASSAAGPRVGSVSSAAAQVGAQMQRMQQYVNGVNQSYSGHYTATMRAVAANTQLTNAANGVTNALGGTGRAATAAGQAASGAARANGSLAAAAARLQAQLNPMIGAQNTLNASLASYNAMARAGLINTQQLAQAQAQAQRAFNATIGSMNGVSTAARNGSHNTANLAAQFQDIGVTAAMGMSPMMIALQQGTQIAAVLGPMGIAGSLKSLGAAFMSVISPVSLLVLAFVALTAVAIQWAMKSGASTEKMNVTLKRHGETVEHLTKLYGEAAAAAENLASSGGEAFSRAAVRLDTAALKRQIDAQGKIMGKSMKGEGWISYLTMTGSGSFDQFKDMGANTEGFQKGIDKLLASMRNGKTDIEGFHSEIESLYTQMAVESIKDPNKAPVDSIRRTADAILRSGDAIAAVDSKFQPFQGEINKLMLGFAEGNADIVTFNKNVEKIGEENGIQPLSDELIGMGKEIEKLIPLYEEAQRRVRLFQQQLRDRITSERFGDGSAYQQQLERELALEDKLLDAETQRVRARTDAEKVAAAGAQAGAENPVKGKERNRQIAIAERQEQERLDAQVEESAIKRKRAYEDEVRQRGEAITMIGKTSAEVEALEFQYQSLAALREEAAATGRTIDEAEIELIKEKSEEIRKMAALLSTLKLNDDLKFELEQLGRNDLDKRIATRLKGTGLGMDSDQAEAMRQADMIERSKERAHSWEIELRQRQEELTLVGKSVGEVARLEAQYKMMADLREEAYETGRTIDEAEIAAIQRKAAELGNLADALEKLKLNDDLKFESEQAGRSALDQKIAARLRGTGLGLDSNEAKIMRDLDSLEEAKQAASDFFSAIADGALNGGEDVGEAIMESVTNWMANYGRKQLDKGLDQIAAGLFGSGDGKGGGFDLLGSIGALFTGGVKSPAAEQNQTKSIVAAASQTAGSVVTNVLGPLNTGISKTVGTLSGNMSSYANAIRTIESSNNYGALGQQVKSGDRAYGAYQVMGNNIPSWTKELLGRSVSIQEFLGSKSIQDGVFNQQFGKSIEKFGTFADAASVWFTGRPISQGGTAYDPVSKINGNQYVNNAIGVLNKTGMTEAVSQGSQAGIKEGLASAADPWAGLRSVSGGDAAAASGAKGSASGTLGGALGSAIGGFGMGFQSESPAMGALSGAVSGFASGGPIGAIIGGIAGAIGGIFGKSSARKKEQGQARQQLNANRDLLQQMFAAGEGRGVGDATSAVNQFYDQTAELDQIAQKAKDFKLRDKLRANYNSFFGIVERDYKAGLQGVLDAYSQGLGSDSPFIQGKAKIEELRAELKNFVADASTFGDLQIKHGRSDTPDIIAARIKAAEIATQQMAIQSIVGARALGNMEEKLLGLTGATAALGVTLEQLGMSADQAAVAVNGTLSLAFSKLKDLFLQDVTASINDLSGFDWLNQIMDAQTQYQSRLADEQSLGLDGSLAMTELSLSMKQIIANADLSKEELDMLAKAFPNLSGMFKEVIEDTVLTLEDAESDLRAAYEKEVDALEKTISSMKSFIDGLKEFRANMKISDSSPLSPYEKLMEAQKQFRDTNALAAGGDQTAMDNLTNVSQAYLDEARSYYATSEDYYKIWNEVDKTLSETQTKAEASLSNAEKQLEQLKTMVGALIDIDDSVKTVAAAMAALAGVKDGGTGGLQGQLDMIGTVGKETIGKAYRFNLGRDASDSEMKYWQDQIKGGKTIDQVTSGIADSQEAKLNRLYNQIFGRNIDPESSKFWLSTGKSMDAIAADLVYAKSQGSFSAGGYTGDMSRDSVAGIVHGQEYVMDAATTSRHREELDSMRSGTYDPGASNESLADEMAAVRVEIQQLAANFNRLAAATAQGATVQIELLREGNSIQAEVASDLRRVTSK